MMLNYVDLFIQTFKITVVQLYYTSFFYENFTGEKNYLKRYFNKHLDVSLYQSTPPWKSSCHLFIYLFINGKTLLQDYLIIITYENASSNKNENFEKNYLRMVFKMKKKNTSITGGISMPS